MKISSIKVVNHPIFGTTFFNFTDRNGKIKDTILLIGENGCGKTHFLELLYELTEFNYRDRITKEINSYTIVLSEDEKAVLNNHLEKENYPKLFDNKIECLFDYSIEPGQWDRIKFSYTNVDNSTTKIPSYMITQNTHVRSLFLSLFSTVEINYTPTVTSTVTSNEIDQRVTKSIKSTGDIASQIQQLFIDIENNDALDLSEWVRKNPGIAPSNTIIDKRISRFKNAFSLVFKNLNYEKTFTHDNKKQVCFKKNQKSIPISTLSSGEKQIIFRGAFLLKNKESIHGCLVLIDEPEISLHPQWQKKIFDYYTHLFKNDQGKQTSQIFMATHSQFVLRSALSKKDTTEIVLFKNRNGNVRIRKITNSWSLPYFTISELNYRAFNIVSSDYHNELYGYIQKKKKLHSIKGCDNFIHSSLYYKSNSRYAFTSTHTNNDGHKTTYYTLPTYIRNRIHHPESTLRPYSREELRLSIRLLIKISQSLQSS